MVGVISTVLNGPFVAGVSLQLLCFEVMNLMTREAQDVSSLSGTRDGVCSDQARPLVKRSLCHLQLSGSLTWLSQISLWRVTELPTSYRKVSMCNAKHTQLWNALYIGFHINNFTDQFITPKLVSLKISWSTREMVYDKHTCLWIRRISKTRVLLQLNLFQTEYWYT